MSSATTQTSPFSPLTFPDERAVPHLLKAVEVAQILRTSVRHIYNLIDRGELRTVHTGGPVRVRAEDLAEFMTGGPR
ncbi:MAG: helix-turn-helix domain-containing protein [Kangiella sp.]|nr:helix-turn-helix domain-containing protein [Kangiella sp.]